MWVWRQLLPLRCFGKSWKHPPDFFVISKAPGVPRCEWGLGMWWRVAGMGQGFRQLTWSLRESKVRGGFCYFSLFLCISIMELQMERIRKGLQFLCLSPDHSYQFVWRCGCILWVKQCFFMSATLIYLCGNHLQADAEFHRRKTFLCG